MQFYLIPAANGLPSELAGTKPDAKVAMKARGLKGQPEDYAHDVPTSKAELMAYVNGLLATADGNASDAQALSNEVAKAPEPIIPVNQTAITVQAMEEFILDQATVAQVENLFARLGTRFAELRKGG